MQQARDLQGPEHQGHNIDRKHVKALVQYNNRCGTWSSNVRFSWLQAANTGLFVVYNDTRGETRFEFPTDRAVIVKFSRMFDLLN